MTDYTPGEWKVATNGFSVFVDGNPISIIAQTLDNTELLGDFSNEEYVQLRGQQKADAQLIAASKNLLVALEDVQWCRSKPYYGERDEGPPEYCAVCLNDKWFGHDEHCDLGNAIKKARGES